MLPCGHHQPPFGAPICEHLRTRRQPGLRYVRWYIGVGADVHMICEDCRMRRQDGTGSEVAQVCEECFDYATEHAGHMSGTDGAPEVRERPEPFELELREARFPTALGRIVDVAPVTGRRSTWLLLGEDGGISRLDVSTGETQRMASSTVVSEPEHKSWNGHTLKPRLHAAGDGRFAAVVNDYGQAGQVLDLTTGEVTTTLAGGDYHSNTVPLSLAFVEINGNVAVLHRTDWNRLDLSEAATGKLLTAREPTSCGQGEEEPAHYLDYFHGALYVNPGGTRVAVDGWVWHPVGVVTTWSLAAWSDNPWESEDGTTKLDVCFRNYYWNHTMTWLDDDRLVVGGIGDDEDLMIDGARVFDVTQVDGVDDMSTADTAREVTAFAGPGGTFLSDGVALFATDETGLSRWDPADGARTGQLAGFCPTQRHGGSGELAQLVDGRLLRWGSATER